MFETIERMPPDPILGLSAACKQDPNPDKVDLTLGVYMDESGVTPVFEAVTRAQEQITDEETTKVYMPPVGDADFNRGIRELVMGSGSAALADGRVASVQTPGGCGAVRLGAELVKVANPEARVWVSDPTWPNHIPLIGSVGLQLEKYRYYVPGTHAVDFDGMLSDLEQAGKGDVVLLHGCCHNPCGADLSQSQWQAVAELAQRNGFTPFVDFAYQGLGDGLEEDAFGVRLLVDSVPEVIVASSCSKNLGLYRERTGAVIFVGSAQDRAEALQSQATIAARRIYSMPPAHGALLAGRVLTDADLGELWRAELGRMCSRINDLRGLLVSRLTAATGRDFGFIQQEKGMFSFLGISPEQVEALREKHSIYMVGSSRINVAGINQGNIDYFANAVASVIED
jgi:aspartate aminotransferase